MPHPQNEREKFLQELGEAFGFAAKELGYTEPGKVNIAKKNAR